MNLKIENKKKIGLGWPPAEVEKLKWIISKCWRHILEEDFNHALFLFPSQHRFRTDPETPETLIPL